MGTDSVHKKEKEIEKIKQVFIEKQLKMQGYTKQEEDLPYSQERDEKNVKKQASEKIGLISHAELQEECSFFPKFFIFLKFFNIVLQ